MDNTEMDAWKSERLAKEQDSNKRIEYLMDIVKATEVDMANTKEAMKNSEANV